MPRAGQQSAALKAALEAKAIAQAEQSTAEARVATERASRRLNVQAGYDAVDPGADTKRRRARVSRKSESDELSDRKFRKGLSLTRDLLRNYGSAKGLDSQRRTQVVGTGPGLSLHDLTEEQTAEADRFWRRWCKDCDSLDDKPFAEIIENLVTELGTDGGSLLAIDTFDRNDGKLLVYSSDMLCEIDAKDWKAKRHQWKERRMDTDGRMKRLPMRQERGLVFDRHNRVVAYVVNVERKSTARFAECLILPAGTAKLWKVTRTNQQFLPVPDYLTMVPEMEDAYEMRAAELQTAKKAAQQYAWIASESLEDNADLDLAEGTLGIDEGGTPSASATENYDVIETLTGGNTEYMDKGDTVHIAETDRPNMDVAAFGHDCIEAAGASIGMSRSYARYVVDNSYTGFRGESLLSWAAFEKLQKSLERRVLDWLVVRVFTWAIRERLLWATGEPANWADGIAWHWRTMPKLDPAKENESDRSGLKNGTIDYANLLGPQWKKKLQAFSDQIEFIRSLDLPLSIFETVAGAEVQEEADENNNTEED
jgi:thiol-disulfide isomerase/thioredoxin